MVLLCILFRVRRTTRTITLSEQYLRLTQEAGVQHFESTFANWKMFGLFREYTVVFRTQLPSFLINGQIIRQKEAQSINSNCSKNNSSKNRCNLMMKGGIQAGSDHFASDNIFWHLNFCNNRLEMKFFVYLT